MKVRLLRNVHSHEEARPHLVQPGYEMKLILRNA